jgi:glycosyltransferase involved in cell wall biosynthesis
MTESFRAHALSTPLSLVIPVHNETECIGELIQEIERALSNSVTHEIIVVDDASTDATPEVLTRLRTSLASSLRVLRHDHQYGQVPPCAPASINVSQL